MALKIVWSEEAEQCLDEIIEYLEKHYPLLVLSPTNHSIITLGFICHVAASTF